MARRSTTWALAAIVALANSCKVAQGLANAPGRLVGVFSASPEGEPLVDLDRVRNDVLRFADRIVSRVDTSSHVFANRQDTPEAVERGLTWRLNTADRAYQTASQLRPVAALLDLLALCVYESNVHERHWMERYGEDDEVMLEVWKSLSDEGLEAVDRLLSPELSGSVKGILARWQENTTEPGELLRKGAPRFEDLVADNVAPEESLTLFGALGLDLFDSLEPAAREMARSRELAERAVFLAQRAPRTLAWRVELLTLRMTRQPDVQTVLESATQTSLALERASATIEALPEKLGAEGDALLQRISTELATQRAGIVDDMEQVSAPTQALLSTAQDTLDAGARLAQAVDGAARSIDEARSPREGADPAASSEPDEPFDPSEYTALATEWTRVLEELNIAVQQGETSMPLAQRTLDTAATRLDRTIESAFGAALRFTLITIGAVVVAILALRLVPARRRRETAA